MYFKQYASPFKREKDLRMRTENVTLSNAGLAGDAEVETSPNQMKSRGKPHYCYSALLYVILAPTERGLMSFYKSFL